MKRSSLVRAEPLRRQRRQRPLLSPETCGIVAARQHGYCICGCHRRIAQYPIGFHHLLPKQIWPELAVEPDNVVGVAAVCHANHETAARRLPRSACVRIERLARIPTVASYLDRTYGPRLTAN